LTYFVKDSRHTVPFTMVLPTVIFESASGFSKIHELNVFAINLYMARTVYMANNVPAVFNLVQSSKPQSDMAFLKWIYKLSSLAENLPQLHPPRVW